MPTNLPPRRRTRAEPADPTDTGTVLFHFYCYCIGALVLSLIVTAELKFDHGQASTALAATQDGEPHPPYDEVGVFTAAVAPLP